MIFVVDTNILFAALIKNSVVRNTLLQAEHEFCTPEYVLQELREHWEEVMLKSKTSSKEFIDVLSSLIEILHIDKTEELLQHGDEAYAAVRDIDEDDAMIIACALFHPGSIIWSEDKKLKMQNKVVVMNTVEMLNLL